MQSVKTLWKEIFHRARWLLPLSLLSTSVYAMQTFSIWFQATYIDEVQRFLRLESAWSQVLIALLCFYAVRSIIGGFVIPFGAAKDLYYESKVTESALVSQIILGERLTMENYDAPELYQKLFRAQHALTSGALRQIFNNSSAILSLLFSLFAILGTFLYYSPWFAALALLIALPILVEQLLYSPRQRDLRASLREQRRLLEQQRKHILDREYFLETQRAAAAPHFTDRFRKLTEAMGRDEQALARSQLAFGAFAGLVRTAASVAMLLLALSLMQREQLSAASLSALLALQLALQSNVAFFASQLGGMAFQWQEIQEICSVYLLPQEPQDRATCSCIGEISLEDVSYRYSQGEHDALSQINLTIKPGEKIALLGTNGAGKSTLAQIVAGLFSPGAGTVRYNGVSLADLDPDSARRRMSAVFQDFGVFQLSIGENVALGWLEETGKAAKQRALDQAGFPWRDLPHGLDTPLGRAFGGRELSRGEGQRLCLARAYLREEAELLIVDEPTAALDPLAEEQLYAEILSAGSGRTTLILSHRLASAQLADRIIILEDGRIFEQGDHSSLLRQNGRYAQMYREQAALYKR